MGDFVHATIKHGVNNNIELIFAEMAVAKVRRCRVDSCGSGTEMLDDQFIFRCPVISSRRMHVLTTQQALQVDRPDVAKASII